jgi:predicted Zn-dependent peptidase
MKAILRVLLCLCLVAASTAEAALQAPSSEFKLPPYRKIRLKNDMTLLLMEQHEVPLISFDIIIRSGAVADPVGKEGVASVTAEMLRKGTQARTAEQLSGDLDFIGGQLETNAGPDYSSIAAEFVKKMLRQGLIFCPT